MCQNAFWLQRGEYRTRTQSKGCLGSTHQHLNHAPYLQLRANKQGSSSKSVVAKFKYHLLRRIHFILQLYIFLHKIHH
jgi:hypothetical protein